MPAMKRPAAASARSSAVAAPAAKAPKVAKTSEPTTEVSKFADIVEAVRLADGFPVAVVDMLVATLDAVAVPKEERHLIQEAFLGMIEEVLDSRVSAMKGLVDAAGEALLAATKEYEAKQEALGGATAAADAADATLAEKKAYLATELESLARAQGAQTQAESAQVQETKAVKAVTTSQATLQTTQEKYQALLTGSPEPSREALATQVLEGLKGYSCDESLLASLSAVLAKEPSMMGDFDKLVLAQLEAEFKKIADDLAAKHKTATDESERASQAAQASIAEAQRLRELVQAAAVEVETAESDVARKADSRKKAAADLQEAEVKAGAAKEELGLLTGKFEALQAGPIQSFRAVQEMSSAAPPPDAAEGVCSAAVEELPAPVVQDAAEGPAAECSTAAPTAVLNADAPAEPAVAEDAVMEDGEGAVSLAPSSGSFPQEGVAVAASCALGAPEAAAGGAENATPAEASASGLPSGVAEASCSM